MSDDTNGHEKITPGLNTIVETLHWAYGHAMNGFPSVSNIEEFVDQYWRAGNDPEKSINTLVNWQTSKAGAAGFIAGLGGLVMLPVTIPVNLATVLFIQFRMILAIARIRGHDLKSDKMEVLTLGCLLGDSAVSALKEVGVIIGKKGTAELIKKIPVEAIIQINQVIGFRLITKAGTRGAVNLSKIIPVVGGLVSGGIDVATTRAIARAAKGIFPASESGHPLPTSPKRIL
jgi:hypothetical protein